MLRHLFFNEERNAAQRQPRNRMCQRHDETCVLGNMNDRFETNPHFNDS
jgi:hypothetical protein